MCEPSHSILQFPTEEADSGVDYTPRIQAATQLSFSLQSKEEQQSIFLLPQGVIIGQFINYSKLGSGHSETLAKLPWHIRDKLPTDMKYEAHWWNREVKQDSIINPRWLRDKVVEVEGLESATEYAKKSSIGDLKMLRRFLETSLKITDNRYAYIVYFCQDFLSPSGRQKMEQHLKKVHHGKKCQLELTLQSMMNFPQQREVAIGIMLKMTRDRSCVNDFWADDSKLWKSEREVQSSSH